MEKEAFYIFMEEHRGRFSVLEKSEKRLDNILFLIVIMKVVLMGALVRMDYHAQNRSRSRLTPMAYLENSKPASSQIINPARTVYRPGRYFFIRLLSRKPEARHNSYRAQIRSIICLFCDKSRATL